MATNNDLNQATEALVIGPIGGTAVDTSGYILKVVKSNASSGMGVFVQNTSSSGFGIVGVQNNGTVQGGVLSYGSAYSDNFGGNNDVVLFSNANASNMNIACENGTLNIRSGASGVVQTNWTTTGGQYRGFNTNTAPAAGYIGERIVSTVSQGSAVVLTSTQFKTVTSISLTAGIWDVTFICCYTAVGGAPVCTFTQQAISTTTNSLTGSTLGDSQTIQPLGPVTGGLDTNNCIANDRRLLSGTTTIFGIAAAVFSANGVSAYGRLSAVRVA